MSLPSADNNLIISIISVLLFILLIHSSINFINHFQFNYKCPYIIRDLEVAGIYPTLVLAYIIIVSLILAIVITSKYYDHTDSAQFISYSSSYSQLEIYTNSLFDFRFLKEGIHSQNANNKIFFICRTIIAWSFSLLFILETYFSFSRYYNVCDITHKYHLSIPFTIYSLLFLLIYWVSLTIVPIVAIFIGLFHIICISYFSYHFQHTIRESYAHIFDSPDFGNYGKNDTYIAMKLQIKQVHRMAVLSVVESIITAMCYYSYVSCSNDNIVIICALLTVNCILLFSQFTKNRIFFRYVFLCQCTQVLSLCKMPYKMIVQRRAQRKWIRDRQKSIFDRLQMISRPSLFYKWSTNKPSIDSSSPPPNVSIHRELPKTVPKPPIHAHSLNPSVDRGSDFRLSEELSSIEILDLDLDPNNQMLNAEIKLSSNHSTELNNPFELIQGEGDNSATPTMSRTTVNTMHKTMFKPIHSNSDVGASQLHTHSGSNGQSHHRPSLSVVSDISDCENGTDLFTRMKTIGRTLREKPRDSKTMDLVKELSAQIQKNANRNIKHELKQKREKREMKELQTDARLLQMKEKMHKQISFGADIALEIINDTITNEFESQNQEDSVLKLNDCQSEPPLMSSTVIVYKNENETNEMEQKMMNAPMDESQSMHMCTNEMEQKRMNLSLETFSAPMDETVTAESMGRHSKTMPNSPNSVDIILANLKHTNSDPIHDTNSELKNENTTKTVFLYDQSNIHSKESNIAHVSHSNLSIHRTQSLIEIPKQSERKSFNIEPIQTQKNTMAENDDGSYIVYDYDNFYNYDGQTVEDINTPLTPTSPLTPDVNNTSEVIGPNGMKMTDNITDYGSAVQENITTLALALDIPKPHKSSDTERSKTRSIIGTIRGIFSPSVEKEESKNKSPKNGFGVSVHSRTKSISSSNKLAKINSFLKQNGMTMHHQNVNEVFRSMRFAKRADVELPAVDENEVNNDNPRVHKNKKRTSNIMETIVED